LPVDIDAPGDTELMREGSGHPTPAGAELARSGRQWHNRLAARRSLVARDWWIGGALTRPPLGRPG